LSQVLLGCHVCILILAHEKIDLLFEQNQQSAARFFCMLLLMPLSFAALLLQTMFVAFSPM
jgi:hypothetical protein